jgi:hypothetical protein
LSGNDMTLSQRWSNLWNNHLKTPNKIPLYVEFLSDHVKDPKYSPEPLLKDVHYFLVQVNEMYLSNASKLWAKLNPMVFATSEFFYNYKTEVVPFIVGPSMIEKLNQPAPNGMRFLGTKVAGLHPYKGGSFTLSVILCQVAKDNVAQKLLKMIEAAAGALDYSTSLNSYLKVAHVVLDGVEELIGIKGISPLMGLRKEFHPEVGDLLKPNYFALINKPEDELKKVFEKKFNMKLKKLQEVLWVIDNQLYVGKSFDEAEYFPEIKFGDNNNYVPDYVLYSLRAGTTRGDVESSDFPFGEVLKQVRKQATTGDDKNYEIAVADLASLWQMMYLSPDLTTKHARELKKQYETEMLQLHSESKSTEQEQPKQDEPPTLGAKLSTAHRKTKPKVSKEEVERQAKEKELQEEATRILGLSKKP